MTTPPRPDPAPSLPTTTVERRSPRELVVTRTFRAPPRLVYRAWTSPELLQQWWAPRSSGLVLVGCVADVRVGGRYRFEFSHQGATPVAFFGRYLEVVAASRLVWTNEETPDGAITTVTFTERAGTTLLVMHELHATPEALDRVLRGMDEVMSETFTQLDALLPTLG